MSEIKMLKLSGKCIQKMLCGCPNDLNRFGIADIKEEFAQTVENQSIDPIFTAQ